MKEKIGMEKLIELLNEFELGEDYGDMGGYYYIDTIGNIVDDGGYILNPCEIISKKFGFIKWLVENDKIDTDKMEEKSEYTFLKKRGGEHIIEDVLMLLSISSSPIEDLVSYLR